MLVGCGVTDSVDNTNSVHNTNSTPSEAGTHPSADKPEAPASLVESRKGTANNAVEKLDSSYTVKVEANSGLFIAAAEPDPTPIERTSDTAEHQADLWQRIRDGFAFDDALVDHPDADARIERYRKRLAKSSRILNRVADNATPYLYFVVTELEKNNIPLEVALLPIVESRYDAFAYSPGRASGLWQFIPGTGRRFGLNQTWWHDERRDTLAATGAAIQYLLYLNKLFKGDWLLAMASYNAGQGTVLKAIRKNKAKGKATDYWSLDLPKETEHYIPKILAWRDIIKAPGKFNVALQPVANKPYFSIVDVGSQIDLAEAARLAEVDIDTIYKLNPAFNRWATDPLPPHDLLVPVAQAEQLKERLAAIPTDQRMGWTRYVIQRNDSLGKIAQAFDITTAAIMQTNGMSSTRIRAGDALLIPSATKDSGYYSKSAAQRLAKRQQQAPKKDAQQVKHRVRSGESLWDIAKRYNVNVKALARWNQMAPGDLLSVNRTLVVWTKQPAAAPANNETRKLFYKVRQGDSLAHIANRFKVKIRDIKNWNKIDPQRYLQPGQLLTLYVALTDRQLMAN